MPAVENVRAQGRIVRGGESRGEEKSVQSGKISQQPSLKSAKSGENERSSARSGGTVTKYFKSAVKPKVSVENSRGLLGCSA